MIKKYLEYAKDNPNRYWFKSKLYGWGWTPVRWQGWAVTFIAIVLIVWQAVVFEKIVATQEPSTTVFWWFLARVAAIILALIVIAWRTGESPRWQWGIPKKENSKN